MRDLFGRLNVPPAKLRRDQRVDLLLGLAGRLLADRQPDARWLGAALRDALADGGDLLHRLGIRPPRGSRATAQRQVRQRAQDTALRRLSVAAGSDASAVRILAGMVECPAGCRDALEDAQALQCPASRAAFTRARSRIAAHQWR